MTALRAWWVFLILTGPLVGVSFIGAVRTYAEASGLGGTAAGVGEAFSPLLGIWAPTFSACEIAAVFLLPFVAIGLLAEDRQSGALKLELQQPLPPMLRIALKAAVLFVGWLAALLAPSAAVLLWGCYGGSIYAPEILTVAAGHLLNAALTIALALAAAAIVENPSTAAIVTLAVTIGTWILSFIAAVYGGTWEQAVAFTPTAIVAQFQHGLVKLDATLIAIAITAGLLALAGVWMRVGETVRRRIGRSVGLAIGTAAVILAATFVRASWDFSESRSNSYSRADERTLRLITRPIRIEVHLAAEDPRRLELESRALSKLARVLPHLQVRYIAHTSIGLFEQTNPQYGEIHYFMGGREVVSRATTPEEVLAAIYELTGISPPAEASEEVFRGHPLAVAPRGAAFVFYVLWPLTIAAVAFTVRRRSR